MDGSGGAGQLRSAPPLPSPTGTLSSAYPSPRDVLEGGEGLPYHPTGAAAWDGLREEEGCTCGCILRLRDVVLELLREDFREGGLRLSAPPFHMGAGGSEGGGGGGLAGTPLLPGSPNGPCRRRAANFEA